MPKASSRSIDVGRKGGTDILDTRDPLEDETSSSRYMHRTARHRYRRADPISISVTDQELNLYI